jgi:hypothetical protein
VQQQPGARKKSVFEQGIGESLPDWEFPKGGALNLKDVENMGKRMDLNAPDQAQLLGYSSDQPFSKPTTNQRQSQRVIQIDQQLAQQHYSSTDKNNLRLNGVYDIHPGGDNNRGFDIDPYGNGINLNLQRSGDPKGGDKDAPKSSRRSGRSPGDSPGRSPGDSPDDSPGRSPGDSDNESYEKEMNDLGSENSNDSGESEESQIIGSQKSINQLIETTTNQAWLERIVRNTRRRGTITDGIESAPGEKNMNTRQIHAEGSKTPKPKYFFQKNP